MKTFGGKWTELKLNAFIAYVKAYLTIMNKAKVNYNWETIYFDGFAGSGENMRSNILEESFFDFDQDLIEDISIYKGSVKKILELEEPFIFDYYYFIDNNKSNIDDVDRTKKSVQHIKRDRIIVRKGDCNDELRKLSHALNNKKYTTLIFLDPFGMQVNWDSIAALKNTKSDIWILLPSGVAINRLLPKSGYVEKHKLILEKFFGLKYEDLRGKFYLDIIDDDLFGQQKKSTKIINAIDKIVELYISQMNTVWKFVTKKPLILRNSKNLHIYHLLFASNNQNALKIASQIIEKRQ